MNINLKLKERRTKINKHKQHQKIKAVRQYKKEIKNNKENPDEEVNKKIARFLENESKEKLESNSLPKDNKTEENNTKIKGKEEKKTNWKEIKKTRNYLAKKENKKKEKNKSK